MLDKALLLHQRGRLAEAAALYREILAQQPSNADALHLLGVTELQRQNPSAAILLIDRAIALEPDKASFFANRGNALQSLGRFDEALESYDRALAIAPDYVEALSNRGLLLHDVNRHDEAMASFNRALAIRPDYPEALNNRGNTLRELKNLIEALANYDRALTLRPAFPEAHNNRGNALKDLKRFDEALAAYDRALALRPNYAEAFNNRGSVLQDLTRIDEAVVSHENALAIRPGFADAHNNRGVALQRLKRLDEALASFNAALALNPGFAAAYNNRGNVFRDIKRLPEALNDYERAISLAPRYVEAISNRGLALRDLERFADALASFESALAVQPNYADAHSNRGLVLHDLKRFDEALVSFDRALAIRPDFAEAFKNRGDALQKLRRLDEALANYDRALAFNPDHAETLGNRATALQALQRYDEALLSYDRALAIKPGYVEARRNRSYTRLRRGDFTGGWSDYLDRDSMRTAPAHVHREPLATDLSGQRILVLRDQGLGDEIFFLRFAAQLKARGATVFYRASSRIAGMIARSGAVDHVVGAELIPDPSLIVSVGDLPFLLGMSHETEIPPPIALPPLPEAMASISGRLGALGPPPYIGVTWRAGTENLGALYKEAPRAELARTLAALPGTLMALQRQPLDGEIEDFAAEAGREIHDLSDLNSHLEAMLAAMALIDEYICVSNTNVHLRCGADRACRVLMPSPPDFRWMAEGRESRWFPGTVIYRQGPDGDWTRAFAELKKDLE